MNEKRQFEKPLPTPDSFRAWLQAAMKVLKISAYPLAVDLGLGRNTIAMFVATDGADIRLGTAKKLEAALKARAKKAGADLPSLEWFANG